MLTRVSRAALITGITQGGSSGNTAPAQGGVLAENSPAMTDRSYVYKEVPLFLAGQAYYVQVAKSYKVIPNYSLTVTLSTDVDLYLFIDERVNATFVKTDF